MISLPIGFGRNAVVAVAMTGGVISIPSLVGFVTLLGVTRREMDYC
jgi:Cu/Ag efflux pump CusA